MEIDQTKLHPVMNLVQMEECSVGCFLREMQ